MVNCIAFVAYFIDQHYSPDQHYKSFISRFPYFNAGEKDLRPYLIPYLYQVSQHCASFSIYAPPPHTLRAGSNIGAWFPFLPAYTKRQVTAVFDGLIAQALRSKYSGLVTHPELVSLLQAPRQGYDIIYSLASYAQHPALQEFPDNVREPRQSRDTTLDRYILRWSQHVQRLVLQGYFFCDRFFYQRLYHNMHPVFRDTIGREAYYRVEHSRDGPLPPSFSLPNLTAKLLAIARFIGQEQNFQQAPHNIQGPRFPTKSLQIREIKQQHDSRAPANQNRSGTKSCFLCTKEHLVHDCPILKDLKKNPHAVSVVKHALVSQLTESDTSALVAALTGEESETEEGDCDDTASVESDNDPASDAGSDDGQDFRAADQQ